MRASFSGVFLSIIMFSCTRTTSPNKPTAPVNTLPVSVNEFKPGSQQINTEFTYDAHQWPSTIRMHSYDTLGGVAYTDSFLITVQGNGTDSPPLAYDITWMIGTSPPAFGATEHHLLYYDGQNRIIKDSTSATTGLDLAANVFSYEGNKVIAQRFSYSPQFPDNVSPYMTDTLTLTMGNVSKYTSYYLGGSSPQFVEQDDYTLSDYSNPLFQTKVAASIGPLLRLTYIGYSYVGDFISPGVMGSWSYTPVLTQAPATLNYVWVTKVSGLVIMGRGTDSNGGGAGDIYTFQY